MNTPTPEPDALARAGAYMKVDRMKTAEEWMSQMSGLDAPALLTVNRMAIRGIQLDAMKEGARRAASKVSHAQHKQFALGGAPTLIEARENFVEVILTTAEQWTEKDL